jgi:hypothetical protein
MSPEELVSQLTEFLRELTTGRVRAEKSPGKRTRGGIMKEATQLSLFAQVVSFQEDVTDRLANRRLQAAWTLARTQSENLIRLAWMEVHEDNALWFLAHSETDTIKKTDIALMEVLTLRPETIALMKTGNDACQMRYDAYLSEISPASPARLPDSRLRPLSSLADMAREAGLIDFYRSYFVSGCHQSHTHTMVLGQYYSVELRRAVIEPAYPEDDVRSAWSDAIGLLWRAILLRKRLGWDVDRGKLEQLTLLVFAVRTDAATDGEAL